MRVLITYPGPQGVWDKVSGAPTFEEKRQSQRLRRGLCGHEFFSHLEPSITLAAVNILAFAETETWSWRRNVLVAGQRTFGRGGDGAGEMQRGCEIPGSRGTWKNVLPKSPRLPSIGGRNLIRSDKTRH